MDPNEMTEHDISEEHVDRIVYDESGRDELLEILETYHTPDVAILIWEVMRQSLYWAHTDSARAWRKEIEDIVRDHITEARKKVLKGDV